MCTSAGSEHPVGGPWRPPAPLVGYTTAIGSYDLAVNGAGDAVQVWAAAYSVVAVFREAGGAWSAPVTVASTYPHNDDDARAAIDADGNVAVAWRRRHGRRRGGRYDRRTR